MFTYEQFTAATRWSLNAIGVYLLARGYGNAEIYSAIGGLALSSTSFIWAMIRHTKVGTILAADNLPEVAGVITKSTSEGVALAQAAPSTTVVPTATSAAAAIARAA